MKREDSIGYIKSRMDSSHEHFRLAKLLYEERLWEFAYTQLYHAVFYAVTALLAKQEIYTNAHLEAHADFTRLYIKSGKFDAKYAKLIKDLYNGYKKGADVGKLVRDSELVMPLPELVLEMINEIEKEINSST